MGRRGFLIRRGGGVEEVAPDRLGDLWGEGEMLTPCRAWEEASGGGSLGGAQRAST